MSDFIVSARKYRPTKFSEVVGQEHITSTLRNAISRNQLAHAYLFCGSRGVGKTTCARIFAKTINCLNLNDGEACGECESCLGFKEGRSFNIHELDAASNNSVTDIRTLTEQVRVPPQIGQYSVYIIDEVHMLSTAAFNAFLKTLEEPPAHAIFILATTEKHKIIPTILSRCQIYDFNTIKVDDSVNYLRGVAEQEGVTADDESLHLMASKARGAMRDALSMFDKAVAFCGSNLVFSDVAKTLNILDYDTYFKMVSYLLKGDYPSALNLFDEILNGGFTAQIFTAGLNTHMRDLMMAKDKKTLPLLEVTGEMRERFREQAAECSVAFLFQAIALTTALDSSLATASNKRLNVELALMKLSALNQKKKRSAKVEGASSEAGDEQQSASAEIAQSISDDDKAELPQLRKREGKPKTAQQEPSPQPSAEPKVPKVPTMSKAAKAAEKSSETQTTSTPSKVGATTKDGIETAQPAKPATTRTIDKAQSGKQREKSSAESAQPQPEQPTTTSNVDERERPSNRPKRAQRDGAAKTISGRPIGSLLERPSAINQCGQEEEEKKEESSAQPIDPDSEEKILAKKDAFIRNLNSDRPRIAMAFKGMEVKGNCIRFNVPSEALYEEIMRNRTEILTLLMEIADVEGVIDLQITIKEDKGELKPIKVEDKLEFLTNKNPNLTLFRKKLNLELD